MIALTDEKYRQGIIVSGSADDPKSVHEIVSIGATRCLGFDTNVEWRYPGMMAECPLNWYQPERFCVRMRHEEGCRITC